MPTPIMHLALAEEILRGGDLPPDVHRLLAQQQGAFLLGHTAPDVQTVSEQARDETHFYTLPRTREGPAHETLFAAHPALVCAAMLPPAHAAFVAGYIAHLLLDEIWLDEVFLRYFWGDWASHQERSFLHNVLRTWMDRRDLQRLNGTVTAALREAEPQGWLPFASDGVLRAWRDWLVEQLESGQGVQTAEVFARRMGISAAEMETVLASPEQMDARVFSRVPPAALRSFQTVGYERSVALIVQYLCEDRPCACS